MGRLSGRSRQRVRPVLGGEHARAVVGPGCAIEESSKCALVSHAA